MRALTAAALLDVWERAYGQTPAAQALALLGAACPETPPADLAVWPVGRRDGTLLALRAQTFGPALTAQATCPACGERLELPLAAADLAASGAAPDAAPLHVTLDGYDVEFRVPAAGDLAALAAAGPDAARWLLARCVRVATHDGAACAAEALPPAVVAAVAERMAAADPLADIRLALTCPACDHAWRAPFDIVSYLWAEVDAWAYRLLREVHTLAAAYGWSEEAILALSPWRRQCYLGMLGA